MRFFDIELKMNIPNALSLVRIALLPVFVVLYLSSGENPEMIYWAFGVLVLSGITDSLDGIIARRFNQITELGKLLDPIADKLTQVTVVICLALRFSEMIVLVVICLVKELFQALGGFFLLLRGDTVRPARWYGKIATTVFYGVMGLVVVWADMPSWLLVTLVIIVALLMMFSFIKYIIVFLKMKNTLTKKQSEDQTENAV